jgi:foldase protein PrsA
VSKKRLIPALGAFFVLAASLAGCGSGIPGNSVASVAGNPITLQAFKHWMVVVAKFDAQQNGGPLIVPDTPPNFPSCVKTARGYVQKSTSVKNLRQICNLYFKKYSSQVMGFLITGYWWQAEAARDHLKVSDAEVQKAYNQAVKAAFPSQAQYQAYQSQTSMTPQDILYRFRLEMVFRKLLSKQKTTVSQSDIANYYTSHKSQFGTPETRDIKVVLARNQADAQAAKAALSSGKSWDTVVKKYSIDAQSKAKGGLLSNVTQGSQDSALDAAAFSAPVNKLEGPVKSQYGYYIFEVSRVTPGTQQTLAQATPAIRYSLTTSFQNNASSAVNNISKKHWIGQTFCRPTYAMPDCSGYKAPKTGTTKSTTG